MTNIELKQRLVEACQKILTGNIENFKTAMADAQQQANEYGPPKDRYDAFRMKLLRQKDMLAQQMEKEIRGLEILAKIDFKQIKNEVCFGSVVFTEDQKLFISIGLGKVMVDDERYYAISTLVPFYHAIAGKKKGELFEFRGTKHKIVEIF